MSISNTVSNLHHYGRSLYILPDGRNICIRPVTPQDLFIEQRFYKNLSMTSKYFRFHSSIDELPTDMLRPFSYNHYPKRITLIASAITNTEIEVVGFTRYFQTAKADTVEFSITIGDAWQGLGIGRHLLNMIIKIAVDAGYRHIEGLVLASNHAMLLLADKLGFSRKNEVHDSGVICVYKNL